MRRLIECVPNFSEGRDKKIIDAIADAIASVYGIKVLNIDPGESANRTVITFVGEPEAVLEAAFRGVGKAAELIDMSRHKGTHPRIGATDVLPLVPVEGVTLEECALMARQLSSRIADELAIPVYCYEAAALVPERKNLAVCRRGEYEGLAERLCTEEGRPDFGARPYDDRIAWSGVSVVGARNFLIAVNFNLDTESVRTANAIAFDVREKGRPKCIDGLPVLNENGSPVMIPGTLKGVKALGWYIEEYGKAQVSTNITDIEATPLHVAYEEICRAANARGARVTGTEIIGLVPRRSLVAAGRYFLAQYGTASYTDTEQLSEDRLMEFARDWLGLEELAPFNIPDRVI